MATVAGDVEVRNPFHIRVLAAIQETPNQTALDIARVLRCDYGEVVVAIEDLRDSGIDIYGRAGFVGTEYSLGGLR